MLNFDELLVAVTAAKRRFDVLVNKYPALKKQAYLVLSLPGGQAGIDSSPTQILSDFPAMVIEDIVKTNALALQSRLKMLTFEDATGPETDQLKKSLDQLTAQLHYHEGCQVEIRFNDLKYDLVWKLQVDDLVNHNLTPQTKASIRIVLGTISQLGRSMPTQTQ